MAYKYERSTVATSSSTDANPTISIGFTQTHMRVGTRTSATFNQTKPHALRVVNQAVNPQSTITTEMTTSTYGGSPTIGDISKLPILYFKYDNGADILTKELANQDTMIDSYINKLKDRTTLDSYDLILEFLKKQGFRSIPSIPDNLSSYQYHDSSSGLPFNGTTGFNLNGDTYTIPHGTYWQSSGANRDLVYSHDKLFIGPADMVKSISYDGEGKPSLEKFGKDVNILKSAIDSLNARFKALSKIYLRSKFANPLIHSSLDDSFIESCAEYSDIKDYVTLETIKSWVNAKHGTSGSSHGSSMRFQYFFKIETTQATQELFPNQASMGEVGNLSEPSEAFTGILESFEITDDDSPICLPGSDINVSDGDYGDENEHTIDEYAESVVDSQLSSAANNETVYKDAYPHDPSAKGDAGNRTGTGWQRIFESENGGSVSYDTDDSTDSGSWNLPNFPISMNPEWTGWSNEGGDGFQINLEWTGF
jgi:hypothetical protein